MTDTTTRPEEQVLPGCWVHAIGQCPDTCTSLYESTVALELRALMPGYFITYEYGGYVHVQPDGEHLGEQRFLTMAFNFNTPLTWEWALCDEDGDQYTDGTDIPTDPTASPAAMARVIADTIKDTI